MAAAAAKCEQVMFEALAKAAEIILLNRIAEPRALPRRAGRTRFNIEVNEVDVLRGMMEYWRRDLHLPLRILIVWRPARSRDDKASSASARQSPEPPEPRATLLERWDVHYALAEQPLTGAEDEVVLLAQVRALWKRIVLLLRTLYSVSLTLPAAQLARRAELAARKTGERVAGSVGFAVCTREADSDAWLLLNGHDSSAYQPNPPLEFGTGDGLGVARQTLPVARCAFGAYSVSVSYLAKCDVDRQPSLQDEERTAQATALATAAQRACAPVPVSSSSSASSQNGNGSAPIFKSPSGLSILLASAPAGEPAHARAAARGIGGELQRDEFEMLSAFSGAGGRSPNSDPCYDDDDDDDDDSSVARARALALYQHVASSVGPSASDRRRSNSDSREHDCRPGLQRANSHAAGAALARPSLGPRQISRSADERGGEAAAYLSAHALLGGGAGAAVWGQQRRSKSPLAHLAAPFGYVADVASSLNNKRASLMGTASSVASSSEARSIGSFEARGGSRGVISFRLARE